MKTATILIVAILLAGNALARLGETSEEASKRYGEPLLSKVESNTVSRTYEKAGICIGTTFFNDRTGKSVVGEISYLFPTEISQSNSVPLIMQMLEANAGGQHWNKELGDGGFQCFRRQGATASTRMIVLTVTLDEYMQTISHRLARLGETDDEVDAQCGKALQSKIECYTNTITRSYESGGVKTDATFFKNKSGKFVIGEIRYFTQNDERSFIKGGSKTFAISSRIILPLLETNTNGQKWSRDSLWLDVASLPDLLNVKRQLHRPGAKAYVDMGIGSLKVTLDEYADFVASETKRLEAEKASQVGKQLKDF